jgi:DNA-binding NarL/FixJ family response regulator
VLDARRWQDAHVTTVLIVDDSDDFRHSARLLLEDDGFEIVGEAEDGDGAINQVERLQPALVVLDVQLAQDDGFDVAEALAARADPPIVVMVSTRAASTYAERLATTPARGFIAKADLSGETLAAMIG